MKINSKRKKWLTYAVVTACALPTLWVFYQYVRYCATKKKNPDFDKSFGTFVWMSVTGLLSDYLNDGSLNL